MQITKFNFIVSVVGDDGDMLRVFVPQPPEMEIKALAPLLGKIFSALQTEGANPLVLMKDWELMLDEVAEKNAAIRSVANSFFERCLLGMSVYTEGGKKVEKLSESETEIFRGTLLFVSALYRYSTSAIRGGQEMREFFTSLTATEFQSSLKKLSSQAQQGIVVSGK